MKPPIRQVPRMIAELQNEKGPDEAATSVQAVVQSQTPPKDFKMNSTDTTTTAPAAASPIGHLPGANERDDVVTQIAIISSLFTVCALAVDDAENWNDAVGARVRQDIRSVLEWGALLAGDTQLQVERKLEALS